MNEKSPQPTILPPGLISSITAGFNSIAGNIYLILFPLVFDLLLWFGPHVRLRVLAQPFIDNMNENMAAINRADLSDIFQATREVWQLIFEHFNLVTLIHTFPVGIPSLMVSTLPLVTPLGDAPIYESSTLTSVFLLWVGFSLVGLICGSWYFADIASKTAADGEKPNFINVGTAAFQTLLLSIILIFAVSVILVPFILILSIFSIINPVLAQIAILVLGIILIWLLLPFVFSPHGIFTHKLSAVKSILISLRLVRRFLPGTGLFILSLLLLSEGLNMLWRFAPESSWMAMVGIFGHAFISTALVSSSFFYYRSGLNWMQEVINRTVSRGIKV